MPSASTKKAPAANGRGANTTAEKAIAELSDQPRAGNFRGIELLLPAKLPATFALDMAEVQASQGSDDLGPTYRLIVGILGREQWAVVRDKVAADGQSMDEIGDIFAELLGAITDPFGVTPGESQASGNS